MLRLLPVLTLLFLACACTSGPAPENPEATPFFDLAGYIDGEIQRLTEEKIRANKSIVLNGKEEVQQGIAINYGNDLRLFREADINRPAWLEKYQVQEQQLSGRHKITTYTVTDSTMIVQRLTVEEDQGVPIKIAIERKTGTVLSDGKHQLVYEPGRGYSVATQQINRFGDDIEAKITVEW